MLLDRDSFVDDVKSFETERYRIKVFTDEGRQFANVEIPYFPQSEEVRNIRARVVAPDGKTTEFQGEVFDRLIVKSKLVKYQAKVFSIPGVEVGSIIEYSYMMTWRQHVPDVLKHPADYLITGSYSYPTMHWTIQHELYTRHARFSIRPVPSARLRWIVVHLADNDVTAQPNGTYQLEVRDIPALEKEEFMPVKDMISSRVHFFYVLGWDGIYWQSEGGRMFDEIEKFIGHSKRIAEVTGETIAANDPPELKLRKIYARVQQIRYVSYEPSKTGNEAKQEGLKENKSAQDVLDRGYAYGNEIDYLFAAMARAAGFQASIVRLTDRRKSVLNPKVLDASQLDGVVVMVHKDKEDLFLDPATRFCPFGLVPWFEEGVIGLRLDKFGSGFVKIPVQQNNTAMTKRKAALHLDANGTLQGTFHVSFAGQEALTQRLDLYDEDEIGRNKAIEAQIKAWLPERATVEVTSVSAWDTSQDDLQVDGQLSVPEFATLNGHRLLFPLAIFNTNQSLPFKPVKRTYPIYFGHSYQINDEITLDYPDGFRPEGVPHEYQEINDCCRYRTTIKLRDLGVDFQRIFSVDGFIFERTWYNTMKMFFGDAIAHDTEQLVLQQQPGR